MQTYVGPDFSKTILSKSVIASKIFTQKRTFFLYEYVKQKNVMNVNKIKKERLNF